MGRLVMFVITIGIIGYIGYRTMYGRAPGGSQQGVSEQGGSEQGGSEQGGSEQGVSAPKQRLDKVRGAAKRIEADQEKSAEQTFEKSETD